MQHLNQLQNDRQHVIRNYDKKGTRLMTRGGEILIQQQRERQGTPINTTRPTTDYYNINRDILAQDTDVHYCDDFEPTDLPQSTSS